MVLVNRLQRLCSDEPTTSSMSTDSEAGMLYHGADKSHLLDRIALPWNKSFWKIKVSNAVTPKEVWAHIVSLNERIRIGCATSALIGADVIQVGRIYIYKSEAAFHRVKILNSFIRRHSAYVDCFFIDTGQQQTISRKNLFYCSRESLKIPQQAICFELHGYDELIDLPTIETHFGAFLNGKTLCAYVLTSQEQYLKWLMNGELPKIKVSLFSIGTTSKLTLYKPILMRQILGSLHAPHFSDTLTNARMSHISNAGILYFHVDPTGCNYIDTQISQFSIDDDRLVPNVSDNKSTKNIALAYDNTESTYYRVQIISGESSEPNMCTCFYIDYGDIKSIKISDLFALHDNDSLLNNYPGQAVATMLNGIYVIDDVVLQRLKGILNAKAKILVKVVRYMGKFPIVNVYKRSWSTGHLFNVNELVRMEFELRKFAPALPIDPFE